MSSQIVEEQPNTFSCLQTTLYYSMCAYKEGFTNKCFSHIKMMLLCQRKFKSSTAKHLPGAVGVFSDILIENAGKMNMKQNVYPLSQLRAPFLLSTFFFSHIFGDFSAGLVGRLIGRLAGRRSPCWKAVQPQTLPEDWV